MAVVALSPAGDEPLLGEVGCRKGFYERPTDIGLAERYNAK
jgi:hypothetical protein